MAYFIQHEEDRVLKDLSDEEVARMCIGRMPSRFIDGVARFISIGDDGLLEKLRHKYYTKEGYLYKRREKPL